LPLCRNPVKAGQKYRGRTDLAPDRPRDFSREGRRQTQETATAGAAHAIKRRHAVRIFAISTGFPEQALARTGRAHSAFTRSRGGT
jgi:hypothetical protein